MTANMCARVEVAADPDKLMEDLLEHWRRRTVALEAFEGELRETRAAATLPSEESDVESEASSDASSSTIASEDILMARALIARRPVTLSRSETPAKRRAAWRDRDIESVVDEESDDDEGASLRALLGKAVEETMVRRRQRIERQVARRREVSSARERRDAGRKIARAIRGWHIKRVRKVILVQSACRRWLAGRLVVKIRIRLARAERAMLRWRQTCNVLRQWRASEQVQAAWRGYKTRCLLLKDAERRERVQKRVEAIVTRYLARVERAKQTAAAERIKRVWRSYSRARLLETRCSSVLTIQRVWRGARARKAVRIYRDASSRRVDFEYDLETVDESDFIDDDLVIDDSLSDVFARIQESPPEIAPEDDGSSPIESKSGALLTSDMDASSVSREHHARRRRRFIREQNRRKRRLDLQSNSASRLARFRSSVARSS